MIAAAVSLVLAFRSTSPQTTTRASSSLSLVECWDGCFDASALIMVDEAGKQRSHSFTTVFDRRCKARSPLECAIQSLLDELDGDTGNEASSSSGHFVEYWWRDADQIKSLEAHRDVDETLCRKVQSPVSLGSHDKIGKQRCPEYGHVMYIAVDDNVLAPTLVFEEEDKEETEKSDYSGHPRQLTSLWSVPACSNRLLRFPGDCLHAVSYPPLEWLNLPDKHKFAMPMTGNLRRAVLLFNTWKEPPLYPPVGEPLVGEEERQRSRPMCMAKSSWKDTARVLPHETTNKELVPLNVPLLGDFSRRGCKEDSLAYMVAVEDAVAALASPYSIHGLNLHSKYQRMVDTYS